MSHTKVCATTIQACRASCTEMISRPGLKKSMRPTESGAACCGFIVWSAPLNPASLRPATTAELDGVLSWCFFRPGLPSHSTWKAIPTTGASCMSDSSSRPMQSQWIHEPRYTKGKDSPVYRNIYGRGNEIMSRTMAVANVG